MKKAETSTNQQSIINTPKKDSKIEAKKLYKWVIELFEKNNLEALCLMDTYEKRIYIQTLQRYSSNFFEKEVMEVLVDLINSGSDYTATFTEKVYVGYSYVMITKSNWF